MIANIPLLDNVRIAAPCHADWNEMEPVQGERVRFCGQCARNVYNLSEMTRREAEDLVRSQEGRLCVRYYLRSDGTMLTKNCPVGVRNARRLFLMRSGSVVALLTLMLDFALARQQGAPTTGDVAGTPIVETTKPPVEPPIMGGIPAASPTMGKPVMKTPEPLMGEVAPVTPPRKPEPLMGAVAAPTKRPTSEPLDELIEVAPPKPMPEQGQVAIAPHKSAPPVKRSDERDLE